MSSSVSQFLTREIPNALNWAGRFRLSAGAVICFTLFWWASKACGIPAVVGMGGSLMSQPAPSVAMGAVAAALLISVLLGRFIVGDLLIGTDVQHEGGLMAALLGMIALIFRMGPVRYALFYMPEPTAFLLLAVELALIYVIVAFCWLILQFLAPVAKVGATDAWSSKLGATLVHVAVMSGCMIFLAASDATAQAYAAVGVSAVLGSMAAHILFPVRSSLWFWISPAVVGVAGYFIAYLNPVGLEIGYAQGLLGALARATPLAYASAGPAGAIFGYWIALGWQQPEPA